MAKLIDPVDTGKKEEEQQEDESALSIDSLTLDDFQPMPQSASRKPHPFEGYPQRKIKIGSYREKNKDVDLMVSATHILALNPKEYVFQDPSGLNQTVGKPGQEKVVDIRTTHSRTVRDERGQNTVVVFDRPIKLGDGRVLERCAICPDHTARAQICFTVNKKTGNIEVDRRYLLADPGQTSRLRRLFEMFNYQQTQSERLSQRFDAEAESTAANRG